MPEYINNLNLRYQPVNEPTSVGSDVKVNTKNNRITGGIAGNANRPAMPDFNYDTP